MRLQRLHFYRLIALTIGIFSICALDVYGQIERLSPSDTTAGNYFGEAVAVDGPVAVIGASGDGACGLNAGAAFIYEKNASNQWMEAARLTPDDCQEGMFFGKAVAISGNRVAVVGYVPFFSGPRSNSVYVFERPSPGDSWIQSATIRKPAGHSDGVFAKSLSLDGDRIVITAEAGTEPESGDGAAYVYQNADGHWEIVATLTGSLGRESGSFGYSSSLRGDRLVVSAPTYVDERPGSVYVFDRDPEKNSWKESGILRGILDFFISVDVDGDRILVGESKAGPGIVGRARIFELDERRKWRVRQTLKPSAKYSQGGFGAKVSLRGDHALVVGFDEQLQMDRNIDRVVYVFERDPEENHWRQKTIIDLGNVAFGSDIDLDDSVAVIGQAPETDHGMAYIVKI